MIAIWCASFLQACTKAGDASGNNSQASYFVDATLGNDSNSGTSASAPWKTFAKVSTSTFLPGTTLYLKRGETWAEELDLPSSGMTIDAYGSGALPIIDSSVAINGWTNEGGGIYSSQANLAAGEALANISENGAMMNFLPWNQNASTSFSGAPSGTFTFNNGITKIYIKPLANPSTNIYLASRKLYGISAVGKSDILVQNVSISRFSLNGVNFQNCLRCSVKSSSISNGGGVASGTNPSAPPDYIYAGNGIEYDTNSSSGTVDGVSINNVFDSGISPQTYASNQSTSGIQIQNSTVNNCGFAGVEISVLSNGGTAGSQISNIVVSGMTITNSGKGWSGRRYGTEGNGIRIMADAGAGSMSGVSVQQTVISGSAGDGIKLGGEVGSVNLSRLELKNNNYGIEVADATTLSLKLIMSSSLVYNNTNYGILFNAPMASGFAILQNTFYNNAAINLAVFGQSNTATIQNNIFYSSSAMTHIYVSSTLAGANLNNNCYNDTTNMFGYNGSAYSTVASFRTSSGFETNGLGGNVNLTKPCH